MKVVGVESAQQVSARVSKVRTFLQLRTEISKREDELKELKKQRDEVERDLLEIYRNDGTAGDKVDGYTTYILRNVFVNVKDQRAFQDTLVRLGMGGLIRPSVNPAQIKSTVKELQDAADMGDTDAQLKLKEIAEVCEIYEQFKVGARSGGRSDTNERFMNSL